MLTETKKKKRKQWVQSVHGKFLSTMNIEFPLMPKKYTYLKNDLISSLCCLYETLFIITTHCSIYRCIKGMKDTIGLKKDPT